MGPSPSLGLHPSTPTDAGDVSTYLDGLPITAYQVGFDNPATVPAPLYRMIGSASYSHPMARKFSSFRVRRRGDNDRAAVRDCRTIAGLQSLVEVALQVTRGGVALVDSDQNFDV
jgi:hypothetical protein